MRGLYNVPYFSATSSDKCDISCIIFSIKILMECDATIFSRILGNVAKLCMLRRLQKTK